MFYYGLEFHDLALESILHISSCIVVCEAFLLKRALGSWSIGPLTYNRPAALCLTPFNHLWLHVEGFEPQAEVRGSAEEGFVDDNE